MDKDLERHLDILTVEIKTIRQAARNVADCLVAVEHRVAAIRLLIDSQA